jgi:hypothetical protein
MNMKTSPNDVSNHEILEVMNTFATSIDKRLTSIEREQIRMRAVMVTKDYLDSKLADQYSDLVRVMRKEDEKVLAKVRK